MPSLLSGSVARSGGSNTFITLNNAQPQLPATETTETGFTVVTDSTLVTSYRSSLGFLLFTTGTITNQIPGQNIQISATGTATVVITGTIPATPNVFGNLFKNSGALQVVGGISTKDKLISNKDIYVNGLQIGVGYATDETGVNNISIYGTSVPVPDEYPTGHENIRIGYDSLLNINQSIKSIAIGRLALSSGTNIVNSIAIGDSALRLVGVTGSEYIGTVTDSSANGYNYVMTGTYAIVNASAVANSNVVTINSITTGTVSAGSRFFTTNGIFGPIDGKTIAGQITGTPGGIGTYAMTSVSLTTSTFNTSIGAVIVGVTTTATHFPSLENGHVFVTIPNHQLVQGQKIRIAYVTEPDTIEYDTGSFLFDQDYYVEIVNTNTVALYWDSLLSNPDMIDDDAPYYIGSPVYVNNNAQKNIAIGTNAGSGLVTGRQNFFFGDNAAPYFTTGSYNFFIGPDVAQNMTRGNGIIAIGSDNLVDGVDDQINIGSVFYYNGDGYLQLNGDVGLGLGYIATSTEDASLAVLGGVGISENIIVGSVVESTATTNGAMILAGGAGIGGSVFIGGGLDVSKGNKNINLSPVGGNVLITPTLGGGLTIYPNAAGSIDNVNIGTNTPANGIFTTVRVTTTATSTSTNTGALQVVGGVGINGNMFIRGLITGSITTATNIAGGARGSLPYQTTSGSTTLLPIGNTTTILVSNGLIPYWADVNSLLSNTATVASKVFVSNAATATYYVTLNDNVNTFSNFGATVELTYNNVTDQLSVGSATSATSTTTGALHVTGGVGVEGSIYSAEGGEYENYLLYVPRVIVSTSTPYTARIGDFWVEPNSGVELQYIQDGANRVWIQFAGL